MTAAITSSALVAALAAELSARGIAFGHGKKPAVVTGHPWIVGFFDAGSIGDQSLVSRDGWSTVGTFHCAGLTPDSAFIAARKLREAALALAGQTVGGRVVQKPRQNIEPPPIHRDDDADPVIFVQYDEWRFRTTL